jgi:two-component sensor histidine kinase
VRSWTFFSLSILLLNGFNLLAQNPYIHQYTTHDGLPSNTVYYIYQDSKKFIWFATDAGVSKYDGTTFTNYRKKNGLTSNEVIRIKEDSFGRLWFFNINGTLNFFYQNKIFNNTNAPFLDSIKNKNFFIDFYQDKDKILYFYNKQFEIFSLNPQNQVNKIKTDGELIKGQTGCKCIGELSLRYLSKNSIGEFIVWTRCELFKLDNNFSNPTKIFDSIPIWRVFPCQNRSCYISFYERGIFRINDKFQAESLPTPIKMSNNYAGINSIMENNDGFLWIATYDQGLFCLKNNRLIRHFDIKEALSLIQDNENNIWISSMKEGIYKISQNLLSHKHYENNLFRNKGIMALNALPGVGVWFTNSKEAYLLQKNDLYTLDFRNDHNSFNVIYRLKNNKLIIGEKGADFFLFEDPKPDPSAMQVHYKYVTSISPIIDIERKIHGSFKKITINITGEKISSFGSTNLYLVNPELLSKNIKIININEYIFNTFYNLKNDLVVNANKNYLYRNNKLESYKELSCFDNKIITDYLILNDTTELFNIEGDSTYLYNRHKFFNLTATLGSSIDLQIRKIISHGQTLYLSTFRNIYKCDNPLNIIDNKPVHLQLLDINFRNIQDILINNDSLYIASDDGLTVIPEVLINKIKTYTPIPYFQSILINDKEIDPAGQELVLRGNNKITFNFSCINYSSTPILYSYKMDGLDTAWTTGTSRNVVYQNLGRGNYLFQLRVCKSSAEWSKPVEYRIIINALFWQHPLFFLFLFVICAALLFLIILRRKNIQIKRRELDHQLITLEQKALQSMMNPHFIFNSLGSIQNYLLQKKSGEAGLYLSQFARLIRQNLNAINAASINLEEEIDRLKNYLDLEKMRMDNKFEYYIEVDDNVEADEIQIPSMIIQPFVENAIWHGISSIDIKGEIKIKFRMQDEKSLAVLIEDNGIGMKRSEAYSIKSEEHLHLGMDMTRKRLEILGKRFSVETSIEFSETSPGNPNPGTRVKLVVPVSS